jgi:hypothetical protein
MDSSEQELTTVLTKRLPKLDDAGAQQLVKAYLGGVVKHAVERAIGHGTVPTTLIAERAEILALVCREANRLLSDEEIAALLRVSASTARSIQRSMLATYDDLPSLALKSAFAQADRDGIGSRGDIKDGYRVKFRTREVMQWAQVELEREGYVCEVMDSTGSLHVLLIQRDFPIEKYLSRR